MNKKIIITVLVVVVLGAVTYFVVRSMQNSPVKNLPSQSVTPAVNNQINNNTTTPSLPAEKQPVTNTPTSTPTPAPTPTPTPKPTPVTNKTVSVSIQNFAFSPSSTTVNKGDTITWINRDSAPHTIIGNGFMSSTLGNGGSYSFKFNNSGTFEYYCSVHPSMKGSIIVK